MRHAARTRLWTSRASGGGLPLWAEGLWTAERIFPFRTPWRRGLPGAVSNEYDDAALLSGTDLFRSGEGFLCAALESGLHRICVAAGPETHLVLAESHVGGAVSGTPTVCSRLSGLVREVGCFGGFRSASLMSVRNGRDQRSRALEWSAVISLAFCGLVEWSAVGPAERSRRSEGGRTADTAGMGGRGYRK